jgi:rhodanese-related sulfurtransferase
LAARAGALRLTPDALAALAGDPTRTLYRYDVRSPEEYAAGHLPGFGSAPGGQLVQETDHMAPVRGARIVLVDGGEGVRAPMTAHWLAQLGWDVAWLDGSDRAAFSETGAWRTQREREPSVDALTPMALAALQSRGEATVVDLGSSAAFVRGHVAGAWWALRSQWDSAWSHIVDASGTPRHLVLTCPDGLLSTWAAARLGGRGSPQVAVLAGGTAAWVAAGLPLASGDERRASPRIDRYRRPYEGTDAPREAMQAYLDWEFGLVDQLARDGTHGFRVLKA